MNFHVQGATSAQPASPVSSAAPQMLPWTEQLAKDGIRAIPTEAVVRSEGRIHVLERAGQPSVKLAIADDASPLRTLLRARMAMGVMPPAATFFASKLNDAERGLLDRLFAKGALQPEESDVRYDGNPDRRLYTKANNLSSTPGGLELTFGSDSGDGPGTLKLQNVGGYLKASVVFDYFGSRATSLVLDDAR